MKFEKVVSVTNQSNWGKSEGIKAGVTVGGKAGIPFVAEGKIDISIEGSFSYSWGESTSKSQNVHIGSTGFDVLPKHRAIVEITVDKCTADIPYKADAVFTEGEKKFVNKIEGVYNGVSMTNV
jgi:hypothetical protein